MVFAEYNGQSINVDFVKNTFEANKSEYKFNITFTFGNGKTKYFNYKIIPSTANIPACRLSFGGNSESTNPLISFYNYINPNYYVNTNFRLTGSSNTLSAMGISSATLISSGGDATMNSSAISFSGNNYGSNMNSTVEIDCDFPIFINGFNTVSQTYGTSLCPTSASITTNNTYINQVIGGNYTNINLSVNFLSVTNEIPVNQVYSVRCLLKKNGAVVSGSNKAYDFRIQPEARIWFVLTNRINGDGSANMILHISESPWLQKIAYAPDSTYTETSILDSEYWFGNWQDYNTGDAYTGVCSTNIPIFDSDEKGSAYGRGDIGTDEAINNGDTSFSRSTIGDDLSSSDIPTVNLAISGCGSYIYALSEADLKNVMQNYVYTDNQTLQDNIKDGLWLWGNNPADFIIDCYYIPFSITNFYDTINANLKFGTYQIPDTSFSAVKESNGDRIVLFNTSFEGVYGDWRDYTQFDYDLYLPFTSGFIKLDVQKYLNKTLRCEMMFDVTTHNLRYYLFADDIVTDRIDGSVGINMPLMATDNVNKAKADRQAILGGIKTGINTATGIVGGVGKITTGSVGEGITGIVQSATNGVIDGIKVYDTLAEKPTENVNGSFSSSMNIYDITYPYLRITERALVIPDKIHELYGYPSYYMGKASALSGYCEISDIRLNGFTGTQAEAEALKNELRTGVIL